MPVIADEMIELFGGLSVTARIRMVKQPRGGYINPKAFTPEQLGAGMEALNQNENVNPSLVGIAVDYLTRFMTGTPANEAFRISLRGASLIKKEPAAQKMLSRIQGRDEESIVNAVKLTGFDVCMRRNHMEYKPVEDINPDISTIENIQSMVDRSLHFFEVYGPKVLDGFTFEGGYTKLVSTGDGDFTTADTLWDFKVLRNPLKKEHTLQLLMYWRMGLHSIHPEFKSIKYLGIYNPRFNQVSRIAVENISADVIKQVETDVIGY